MLFYAKMLYKTLDFIETVEVYELKVPEVKAIIWPLSKVTPIYPFKQLLWSSWAHKSQVFMCLGKKVYSNNSGHVTKIAAMPLITFKLKKITPAQGGLCPLNLVYSISTKFV